MVIDKISTWEEGMRKFADVLRSIVALLAIARRIQPDEHRLTEFLDNVYQELEIADGAISRLFDQSLKNYHITSGGYASLLNAVFGEKFPELATLVKHEIILVLSTEGYPIEKSKFHSLIWTNLFHKLVDGDWSSQLNVLDKLKIDAEISTLTEREQKVIRLRFGLEPDEKQYTLREVGEIFHLTHQRIRDIEMKALRKLRHPSRSRNLQHLRRPMHERYSEVGLLAANNEGVEPDRYLGDLIQIPAVKTLKEELHTAQTERASLYDENRSLKELLPKTMEQVWERQRQFLSLPIYDLELSVRAYTCLRNADIRSVRELCVYTEQDLYAIRSFGKKSMAEIKDILGGMSLKLGMDASEISIILGEKTL